MTDQNVKICSGRFSAGLGAAVSWRGLMIGGGGSTTKRAAADVIGAGCGAGCGGTADDVGTDAVPALVEEGTGTETRAGRDSTGLVGGAIAGRGVTGRSGGLGI